MKKATNIAHVTAAPSGGESPRFGVIKVSQTSNTNLPENVSVECAYSQSLEDFKIVSEKSGIFSVLIDSQQIDFSSDALELSLAGRWMLATYRYSYWGRILTWPWQGSKGAAANTIQLKEREGTSGRAFDIVGGSLPVAMFEEDMNKTLTGKLLLIQHDGWKWKYIQKIAGSMSCWVGHWYQTTLRKLHSG